MSNAGEIWRIWEKVNEIQGEIGEIKGNWGNQGEIAGVSTSVQYVHIMQIRKSVKQLLHNALNLHW